MARALPRGGAAVRARSRRRIRSFWLIAAALLVPAVLHGAPPRLTVLLVVDQFPRDYLDRFAPYLGKDGFRRVLDGGIDYRECHHDHFLTTTAPGHAALLTGAYPVHSGIVNNQWYSRTERAIVSSVHDPRYPPVGGESSDGGASPLALRAPTVSDTLRTGTRMRGRVVSISIKDRGAIMLGGRRPSGAYWFDERTCRFVTSRYYAAALPAWVDAFNASGACTGLLGRDWARLRPDLDYAAIAGPDDAAYEMPLLGLGRAFPHPVREWIEESAAPELRARSRFAALTVTPFGNDLVLSFARAALAGEALGKDEVPDLLTLSLSSNDYVGHSFGPDSQEVFDITLRTDRLLAELLSELDRAAGRGRWLLVLTSDHGVAAVPESLERAGVLAEREDHHRYRTSEARSRVEAALALRFFGATAPPKSFPGFFAAWDSNTDPFIYVHPDLPAQLPGKPGLEAYLETIAGELQRIPGVARVFQPGELASLAASSDPIERRVYRSWHRTNGGDLLVLLEPYWISTEKHATTHGGPYRYDTHVPLVFFGGGIAPRRVYRRVEIVDLASTLSHLLAIPSPALDAGTPLHEVFEHAP